MLEEGHDPAVLEALQEKGHNVASHLVHGYERLNFGNGQIITRDPKTGSAELIQGVLCAGSDSRADGLAFGW